MSGVTPPAWARRLLNLALPADGGGEIVGDLEEEYVRRLEAGAGRGAARWYMREAVRLAVAFGWERVREGRERRRKAVGIRRWEVGMLEGLGKDVRFAVRTLLRAPGFGAVVLLTLALGIGATVAIFSVVDGILFRPLPYPDPDELVMVWADYTRRDGPTREWLGYRTAMDLESESGAFAELGLWGGWFPTLTGRDEPAQLRGAAISEGMFSRVLRVSPELGRTFAPEEDLPNGPRVVLLSHGFWSSTFGADAGVIGRSVTLDGQPTTVVGVMPRGFRAPFIPDAQVWQPLGIPPDREDRGAVYLRSVGRLGPDVTVEAADTRLATLSERLAAEYPRSNTGVVYDVYPLHAELVSTAATGLWVLLGAVGLILLIVCVNVANLLLSRAVSRQGELAVRAALGAGRRRLARQLLVESAVLGLIGGVLGIGLAYVGVDLLVSLAPEQTPRVDEVVLDGRILVVALAISLGAGLLFGLLPALRAGRADLRSALVEGGRSGGSGGGALARSGLVVAQVALAMVLLFSSGLLIRSLQELNRVDLGFEPENLLVFGVNLPASRYGDGERRSGFVRLLEARLSAMPGVDALATTNTLPMSGFDGDTGFRIEGRPPPPPEEPQTVWIRRTTPGYFDVMGIELEAGRDFRPAEDAESPRVVIINRTMARRYFPDQDPVGQRINLNSESDPIWREIVGIAEDVKNFGIRRESDVALYLPYHQAASTNLNVLLRTTIEPTSVARAAREELSAVDPGLAVALLEPMTDLVSDTLAADRFITVLLGSFAALALVLAVVGLYGVISYGVGRRSRELGIRAALGARGREIVLLVVRGGLVLTGTGLLIGLVAAVVLTRLMENLLFGVSATDPSTFVAVALLLATVAAAASYVPARRAARLDPARVLKSE